MLGSITMVRKKQRTEIDPKIAAEILFLSDRTCCVCRQRLKPVQLHHIDGDPDHSNAENLAVLCFDCHWLTQLRGGFDRKLDSLQVIRYKQDWIARVEAHRSGEGVSVLMPVSAELALRYVQSKEESAEYRYTFEAEYPLIISKGSTFADEVNSLIEAFVTQTLQEFRVGATSNPRDKLNSDSPTAWDTLSISHRVGLYTRSVLSIEFDLFSYNFDAVHPNTSTKTLNFALAPPRMLSLTNIFVTNSKYLRVLSGYCIEDLTRQQPARWADPAQRAVQLQESADDWIAIGAGPEVANFERIAFRKGGAVIHFDPYQVGSYAEGKYEVAIPSVVLQPIMRGEVLEVLGW